MSSEMKELARLMERHPEAFDILDEENGIIVTGIEAGGHEWNLCVEALKLAAEARPERVIVTVTEIRRLGRKTRAGAPLT
jgi:hypothetical protein